MPDIEDKIEENDPSDVDEIRRRALILLERCGGGGGWIGVWFGAIFVSWKFSVIFVPLLYRDNTIPRRQAEMV